MRKRNLFRSARQAGRVCSEFVMCYPPGIPILAPGEQITEEIIDYIAYAQGKGMFHDRTGGSGWIERLNVSEMDEQ